MWQVATVLDGTVLNLRSLTLASLPSLPSIPPFHKLNAPTKLELISYVLDLTVFPTLRSWLMLFISSL